MLIRRAELSTGDIVDLRIDGGRIGAIGRLAAFPGEAVVEADGGLLLPGLHDHHLHLCAYAASLASVRCGPPEVRDAASLADRLGAAGPGWLRGVGYHESVAGMIDARWLDRVAPERPVRVQHRSGRMWVFNSAGLERLLAAGGALPEGLERNGRGFTGRLFDADDWLRARIGAGPPDLAQAGVALARMGVTGVTEISPANDAVVARHIAGEIARDALPQRVLLAGRLDLASDEIAVGPYKLHLHEAYLPDLDETSATIAAAHEQGRSVAIHCATEVELVFALAALREGGGGPGDRIEHASVAPDALVEEIAAMELTVVSQPHFIAERGDAYRASIPREEWDHLYRLRSFRRAGVRLAAGSDAPFGKLDPWASMAAAMSRHTAAGKTIGAGEALSAEEALALYLGGPDDPGSARTIRVGGVADLCLLDRPWSEARRDLHSGLVRATFIAGRVVHDRIDQSPVQRGTRVEAAA